MKPRFDNKGLNILYYTLFYGSGIAAGLALIGYFFGGLDKSGKKKNK